MMDSLFRRRSDPPAQPSSSNPPYAQPVSSSYATPSSSHSQGQQVFGPPHARPVPYTSSGSVPYAQPVGSYGASSLYPRVSVGPTPVVPNAGPSLSGQMPTAANGGIRVTIKPAYRVAPAVQLSPQNIDVPRSTFMFDFDLERKIIEEAERGNWERSARAADHSHSNGIVSTSNVHEDPVVSKYVATGLPRDAVQLAVATFGDVQNKVLDFCSHFGVMKEMGFAPEAISGALAMFDNDRDKAIAQLAGG
eukprot:TRINITY_DN15696_c0_g1_i1.p1 TRINITY_DN15696_c0_g1~~TRINITY_DN15696_c0_g1_i1.p1  ORF type:complete len:249 (-),score=19.17 TRINITY_DN15696_c0_g1_i1:163-909(-)